MHDRIYRLVDEESGERLVSLADIEGFFVDRQKSPSMTVRLIGTDWRETKLPVSFDDVELQITDSHGEVIGSYYIGLVQVVGVSSERSDTVGTALVTSFNGFTVPYPAARSIWRRWAAGGPTKRAEWLTWPPDAWTSWLHVVQCAWFTSGRSATRYSDSNQYVLEGRNILSPAAFYCSIGECVNGIGGYFGSNLDALADCLTRRSPGHRQFILLWNDFNCSAEHLGRDQVDQIAIVLQEYGVEVVRR
jgi:RNAse (barnase) inhibitor barstar